jgi:hypothetical protein
MALSIHRSSGWIICTYLPEVKDAPQLLHIEIFLECHQFDYCISTKYISNFALSFMSFDD